MFCKDFEMKQDHYQYHSLEDFLATNPLTVDSEADDGGGFRFPIKGREIEATVLFCDISGFSHRTYDLSPTETLIFVNHFFTWISAEALGGRPGIVDKYIGDEIMVVFSKEFGSADPFADALKTARSMCDYDPWSFAPHVGIASGPVTVGYVGTRIKYNCSVFGQAVAVAARCARLKPEVGASFGATIFFPAADWTGRKLHELIPPKRYQGPNGEVHEQPSSWEIRGPRSAALKNMPNMDVMELVKLSVWVPQGFSAEQEAKETLNRIKAEGRYWGK
jgi:Adenylate and Guanylate cyclase catalytic domain